MRFIWATRGRTWGFRFLRSANLADPLPAYSAAFADFDGSSQLCERVGDVTALRFEDPLGRTDLARRVIPHDFVLFGRDTTMLHSVAEGIDLIWPLVEDEYARNYEVPEPAHRSA